MCAVHYLFCTELQLPHVPLQLRCNRVQQQLLMQVVHAYQGLLGGSAAVGTLNQKERSFCWAMVSEACSAGARGASATKFMIESFDAAWKKLDAWVAPDGGAGAAAGGRGDKATVEMIEAQKAKDELQTEAAAVCSALCTALEQLTDDDVRSPLFAVCSNMHAEEALLYR